MPRRELQDMIDLADRLLAADEIGVLATLFAARGSTYRPLASMMVAGPGSMIAGGVSGGCLEEYIARHGRCLVQKSAACMLSFDADPEADDADKPTLGCGGSIEVLVERLTPEHVAFLRDLAAANERDVAGAARCDVFVAGDGVVRVERSAFSASRSLPASGARTLMYRVEPLTRLVILGAGDDVKPLCAAARSLDWHVTVADRRGRRASPLRFPQVDRLIAAGWEEAVEQITFSPRTAVVLMTHSLADDVAILPLLVDRPMAYFGALGPPHRRQWVIDGALATASLPEAFIGRFKGPIGLNLGERTPAGIALAITAEIAATLNERNARPLSDLASNRFSPAQSTRHG